MSTEKTTGITEVRTETIEGAKELIRHYRENDTPTYVHGAPGLGKSDAARQVADEAKVGFKDVRIGTMLPEDLTGIPVPDLERKIAVWLRAEFWPNEQSDGKDGIIMFDELSDANRNLQSCVYRVILDRQIGDYKLPPGWWPMAAGNRREDRAAAGSISTALANRFAHIHVRADFDSWKIWANQNGMDPMLVGFLNFKQDLLHNMGQSDMLAFPTPRSWSQASKYFSKDAGLRFRLLSGIVGDGAAIEVENFFKVVDLPDLADIIKDPMHTHIPDEPASRYALSSLLARKIDKDNFAQIYKYINRDDFGADFSTVVVLDATKRDSDLCDTKTFVSWAKNNKALRL